MSKTTLSRLQRLKREGEKFTVLTAYDASFAQLISEAGVDVLLVGDSLGMVIQGRDSTVPVTMANMIYHTTNVSRGKGASFLMADLPFMSYSSPEQALDNAALLMQAGAQMVKLEGGGWLRDTIKRLDDCGIPICAHIGLTPQSVHKIGGYKIQGRDSSSAQTLLDDALLLESAGADILLMECVPSPLAQKITQALSIPTIGIGAGPHTDAQVLVMHDMLGIASDYAPKFVKNFLPGNGSVQGAIGAYVAAVKDGSFPGPEHIYES